MDEEKREARRRMLAQIKSPEEALKMDSAPEPPGRRASDATPSPPVAEPIAEPVAEPVTKPAVAAPLAWTPPVPSVDELDAGWGDDEEDEEDEPEESEPELPDERLDPVAYAEAKKARDERAAARALRKAERARQKKARRKARAEAARAKQKGKSRKANASRPETTEKRARTTSEPDRELAAEGDELAVKVLAKPRASKSAARASTNVRMLGVAIVLFLAAAAAVAATVAR